MRLRNLFFAVFLCLLGPCTVFGAELFNGTSNYISIADNAALTLPDADWTIAGWFKPTSTAWGGSDQALFEFGTGTARIRAAFFSYGGSVIEEIYLDLRDDDGSTLLIDEDPGGNWTANTDWNLLVLQRSGSTITIYVNGSAIDSASVGNIDAINPSGNCHFGRKADTSDYPLNGALGPWAKWDRAITAGELTALSQGFSASCIQGFVWFTPMLGGAYQELKGGLTVTNNGTTATAHPRLYSCN